MLLKLVQGRQIINKHTLCSNTAKQRTRGEGRTPAGAGTPTAPSETGSRSLEAQARQKSAVI